MLTYPVKLIPDDNGTVRVEFPDVPGANTFGEDEAEALARAGDALLTVLGALIEDRQPLPKPATKSRPKHAVQLSALAEAKIALYEAMRAAGLRKAELARRLNVHMPQVDRLLDLGHASRLDQIEGALKAVGKELVIEVRDAA